MLCGFFLKKFQSEVHFPFIKFWSVEWKKRNLGEKISG